MKKNNLKILFTALCVVLLSIVFAIAAFAATPGTGYCVNTEGKQTNIKYTMTEDGVLTFEIDPDAKDKIQTTVLYNKDPVDGSEGYWGGCLTTFAGITKAIIGDGITQVDCLMFQKGMKQVEIPESLTVISGAAFQTGQGLESVYIRGTTPVKGLFDLSNITSLGIFSFDDCKMMTSVKLNPELLQTIPLECFKCTGLVEIEIPASVPEISDKAFMQTNKLQVVTVLGKETTFASDSVFANNDTFPAIKAYADSKAAEFAKANGYTFIDLESGDVTEGSKPTTTAETTGEVVFNHEGATLWGLLKGEYSNNWWAYYDETKTLEFVSAVKEVYNETGTIADVSGEYISWAKYKDEIEHIIIGDHIMKISGSAFLEYPALKDVKLGRHINQIDWGAFMNCGNLSAITRSGGTPIEGRADLSGLVKVNDIIRGTKITEIILPSSMSELPQYLPYSVQTMYAFEINDALIEYAKENLVNLQSMTDPSVKYEYWVYVDPTLPACGERSVFDFDEATGTLTVYGAGKIDDIKNYYGGGAKNQPWINIKQQVKHIVISETITSIGKYAFCEFKNLETVQIPATDGFEILTAAFEKCTNLKSVFRAGTEPIEGTADIRNVHTVNPWTFAYDFLIANVIISPEVDSIGSSVFEENISANLTCVYGTPGSYAETYAAENGLAFYDVSSNVPAPVSCTIPESTDAETELETEAKTDDMVSIEDTENESAMENETDKPSKETSKDSPVFMDGNKVENNSGGNSLPIIIAVISAAVVAAVVVIILVAKKKKAKK